MEKKPFVTVDLEDYNDGLHIEKGGYSSIGSAWWLLNTLDEHGIKAVFYILGKFAKEYPKIVQEIWESGHIVKSHGENHYRHEKADRKPYSWLGFTGGFYFRFFPLWFTKWNIRRKGFMYVHPHDLDQHHPRLKNRLMNWKRHVGLKTARRKFERLLREVSFASARD